MTEMLPRSPPPFCDAYNVVLKPLITFTMDTLGWRLEKGKTCQTSANCHLDHSNTFHNNSVGMELLPPVDSIMVAAESVPVSTKYSLKSGNNDYLAIS